MLYIKACRESKNRNIIFIPTGRAAYLIFNIKWCVYCSCVYVWGYERRAHSHRLMLAETWHIQFNLSNRLALSHAIKLITSLRPAFSVLAQSYNLCAPTLTLITPCGIYCQTFYSHCHHYVLTKYIKTQLRKHMLYHWMQKLFQLAYFSFSKMFNNCYNFLLSSNREANEEFIPNMKLLSFVIIFFNRININNLQLGS